MLQEETVDSADLQKFQLGDHLLSLKDYQLLLNASVGFPIRISKLARDKLKLSVAAVADAIMDNRAIYGITTGFGGMSDTRVDCQQSADLQANLLNFLAAGAGPELSSAHTRGAMLLRANVLLQGKSGVRVELIERLLAFFKSGMVPVVRQLGSIGASGDLIPLATIARAITGHSNRVQVRDGETRVSCESALKRLGLKPIQLQAKEGLALVNGTSFSSAIAANATLAAQQSLAVSFAVQSILMTALEVDVEPFQRFVHQCKPHPGQIWSAETMRGLLMSHASSQPRRSVTPQDRYSLRCFPQYTGAIVEGIARITQTVETEMNSVSDNPLIDPDDGKFYQSGNFLGQYIAIAMDDLRRYVALLAKHIDVQIASLVAPEFNSGLNVSLRGNDDNSINMGMKGLQICGNSIVPLLTQSANPLVEHFPTHAEQFNQNINGLSWGAANLAWNSMQTFQQYLAVSSLFAVQAIDLRAKISLGHYDGRQLLSHRAAEFYQAVCRCLGIQPNKNRPYLYDDADRWLEQDVDVLASDLSKQGDMLSAVGDITASFDEFCESV